MVDEGITLTIAAFPYTTPSYSRAGKQIELTYNDPALGNGSILFRCDPSQTANGGWVMAQNYSGACEDPRIEISEFSLCTAPDSQKNYCSYSNGGTPSITGNTGDDMFKLIVDGKGYFEYLNMGGPENQDRLKWIKRDGGKDLDMMIPSGPPGEYSDYRAFLENHPEFVTVEDACLAATFELSCNTPDIVAGCGSADRKRYYTYESFRNEMTAEYLCDPGNTVSDITFEERGATYQPQWTCYGTNGSERSCDSTVYSCGDIDQNTVYASHAELEAAMQRSGALCSEGHSVANFTSSPHGDNNARYEKYAWSCENPYGISGTCSVRGVEACGSAHNPRPGWSSYSELDALAQDPSNLCTAGYSASQMELTSSLHGTYEWTCDNDLSDPIRCQAKVPICGNLSGKTFMSYTQYDAAQQPPNTFCPPGDQRENYEYDGSIAGHYSRYRWNCINPAETTSRSCSTMVRRAGEAFWKTYSDKTIDDLVPEDFCTDGHTIVGLQHAGTSGSYERWEWHCQGPDGSLHTGNISGAYYTNVRPRN